MSKLKGLYILEGRAFELIYGPNEQKGIASLVDLLGAPVNAKDVLTRPDLLSQVEVIFSGWGGPQLSESFLRLTPNLKALFYGAGSVFGVISIGAWNH